MTYIVRYINIFQHLLNLLLHIQWQWWVFGICTLKIPQMKIIISNIERKHQMYIALRCVKWQKNACYRGVRGEACSLYYREAWSGERNISGNARSRNNNSINQANGKHLSTSAWQYLSRYLLGQARRQRTRQKSCLRSIAFYLHFGSDERKATSINSIKRKRYCTLNIMRENTETGI